MTDLDVIALLSWSALLWMRTMVVYYAAQHEVELAQQDTDAGRGERAAQRRERLLWMPSMIEWINRTADFRKWKHEDFYPNIGGE